MFSVHTLLYSKMCGILKIYLLLFLCVSGSPKCNLLSMRTLSSPTESSGQLQRSAHAQVATNSHKRILSVGKYHVYDKIYNKYITNLSLRYRGSYTACGINTTVEGSISTNWNIYFYIVAMVRNTTRLVPPFNSQGFKIWVVREERSLFILDSPCLPCFMRYTVGSRKKINLQKVKNIDELVTI